MRSSTLLSVFFLFLISSVSFSQENKLPSPTVEEKSATSKKRVEVLESYLTYVDLGRGDPVIFLHGNPTSSYLWRNIMPYITDSHRAIAPDLIGMGDSGKIDHYSYDVHYQYLSQFIEALGLKNITFVVHDWGAALGFDYAKSHPKRVKRIAFMEGLLPPVFPQPSFQAMGEEMGGIFQAFKDKEQGDQMVIENHMFVETILPNFVNRPLGELAMNAYRKPYINKADRDPLIQWPRDAPIAGEPKNTSDTLDEIKLFMQKTKKPILLIYAKPGVLVNDQVKQWYIENIRNLETAYIGQGLHFIQEDQPAAIGLALKDWLRRHDK